MAQKKRSRIISAIVGAAMFITTLTPFSAFAEDPDYILNISDQKLFDHNTNVISQVDSADLNFYGGPGSSITSDEPDTESEEPLKVKYSTMSDWKSAFWTEGKNFATDKNTVFDIEFKVSLDDYSQPSPYYGLRLYSNNNYVNCNGMGWRGVQLTERTKNKIHNMRFVLSKGEDGKSHTFYSLDGAAYQEAVGENAVPTEAANWGYLSGADTAQIRIMPYTLPSGGRDANPVDGESILDTPVNFEFYSFKAYQTDEVPAPPAEPTAEPQEGAKDYILNISDSKVVDDSTSTISQSGSVTMSYFAAQGVSRIYSDAPRVASDAPIKVEQTKSSEYKTTFRIPADGFTTEGNTVLDVQFKVSANSYEDTANVPFVGLKLSSEDNNFNETNGMTWGGKQLKESEKDKMHTMRFILTTKDDNTARIYYSYDGAEYGIEDRSTKDMSALSAWGANNIRLYPVATNNRFDSEWNTIYNVGTDDGVKDLASAVNWEIYSIKAYKADEIPAENEGFDDEGTEPGGDDVLPTAMPVVTEVPIPSDLKGQVVRSYPEGKMKAAVISLDDGADWCVDSDLKAIEILKRHNAKATFNIVPGNYAPRTLANLQQYYEGMEVASHSNTHPQLDELSDADFYDNLALSRTALENAWGGNVFGLAYPYSCKASSQSERLYMIQEIGFKYARNCLMTGKYDIPKSFYDLNPTCWVSVERDWVNGTTEKFMNEFKALDASDEWKMMFLAGHAWQFNADENEPRNDIWDKFETFAQYLEDNSDTIWNPTTIELVEYVTAARQMEVSKDAEGNVTLKNPSDMNVWANVNGVATEIPANDSVVVKVKAALPERDFVAKDYILDIDKNITVNDRTNNISDNGTLVSTLGVQSSSTSDVFTVRSPKKSIWGGYLNVTSPAVDEIELDKPVVIEAKFKPTLEDYSVAVPKVRLALALTNFGIYANNNVGTPIFEVEENGGYTTVKFIVDPVSGKVYYGTDNKFSEYTVNGLDTMSSFENGIRLYMQTCPNDDNMSNDGDNSTVLSTPVQWNFDYVKMYKLDENDALKLVSGDVEVSGNKADYTVNVRNNYPSKAEEGTVIVALYSNGRLVKTAKTDVNVAALSKETITGSFDVTGLTNYTVKAFLWDGTNTMHPYDISYKLD